MSAKTKDRKPLKWASRFLEWYCADHLLEEIQGDLNEAFYYRSRQIGVKKANWYFIWDVIRFFRVSSFRKIELNPNPLAMNRNYFKSAYRNFINNKATSIINLSGLVAGILSCLLISLHVLEEFSYDTFHPSSPNTYRVVMDMFNNNELAAKSAPVYPAVGPNLVNDFPEVIDFARILPFGNGVYSVKRPDGSLIRFNEDQAVFADHNFFNLFGFQLIEGNPDEVLAGKNQVVLSASTAKRYFGNQNPIGKTIIRRGENEVVVTGIMEDFPENSHMQFDIISSLNSWDGFEEWPQNWGWYDFYTFIKVNDQTDIILLEDKIDNYLDEKKAESYEKSGSREILWLQNVADIHLYSKGLSWDMGENGGANNVYFLAAIAILILIIAWVNFINLSTARAVKRAKEVGIRKVVGAKKRNLINQFLTEAFIYNTCAVLLSLILTLVLIPVINGSLEISLEMSLLLSTEVVAGFLGLIFLGTFISGLYPSFVLTSFKPLNVLKGNFYSRKSKFGFRQVLVIFQFTVSIMLILGTVLMVKQLKFMQSRDLGLNVEKTLVLRAPSSSRGENDLENRQAIFSSKLEQLTAVDGFTVSNVVPGVENFSIGGFYTRESANQVRNCYRVRADENYFPDFDIEIIEGRNFEKALVSDSNAVIMNLQAAKLLGFSSPETAIGEILNPGSQYELEIIGVAENYHHSSLKESLDPILFFYRPNGGNYLSIKLGDTNLKHAISSIEEIWDHVYPDNPFDFFFLDEFFDRQYKSDEKFNAVFIGFAGLAIFVACLGLFGLISFTAEQSKREIGIRKVLGASVTKVMLLLVKDYAILMALSILLAFPAGYYLMNRWLEDFAYKTNIGISIFVIGGISIALITCCTVSFKSFFAANSNPIETLHEE